MAKKRKIASRIIIWAAVLAFVVWLILFGGRYLIFDAVMGIGYEPSSEITSISESLTLTDRASFILRGTRAEVQDAEAFNESCATQAESSSTLGCYNGGKIYIYNINHSELSGVKESIMAHELLHAVWGRTLAWDRAALESDMRQAYEENRDILEEYMSLYDDQDFLDELHSRLGTQIEPSKLSKKLQDHYAQYFSNPQKVYEYYTSYNNTFVALRKESEDLYKKIEELRPEIEEKRSSYEAASKSLNDDIDTFNQRANNGYYTGNQAGFDADRQGLIVRQKDISKRYQELTDLITEINGYIDRYNANILHAGELHQVMDSNAAPKIDKIEI